MPLSSAERYFIENWKEQKSGPKWKFYLLFTIAWTIVSFLVIFFLTKLFTRLWETGGQNLVFVLVGISLLAGILSTHLSYVLNEKKLKRILKKNEVQSK